MPSGPFGLIEDPFAADPDARFIYPSRAHRGVVMRLRRAIERREAFVLVTGPPGAGKTVALQAALAPSEPHILLRIAASRSLGSAEFGERLLSGLAPEPADPASPAGPPAGIETRLREAHTRGLRVILVVDEAQELGPPLLEELRVLSGLEADGHGLLQIILVGQPKLEEELSHPDHGELWQSVAVRCRLGPLSAEETEGYIRHRLAAAGGEGRIVFRSASCQAVHRLTHGIPREIDLVAGEALALAHTAGESAITAGHVTCAAVLLGFRSVVEDSAAESVEVAPAPDPEEATADLDTLPLAPGAAALAGPPEGPPRSGAEIPVPTRSKEPPPAPTVPVGPAARATPAPLDDPQVEAWLSRFRDPSGPPRIGSRLSVAPEAPEVPGPRATDAGDEGLARAASSRRSQSHRPASHRRSSRDARKWRNATGTASALLLLVAGGLVLATWGRSLQRARPSVRVASATVARTAARPRTSNATVTRPPLAPVSPAAVAVRSTGDAAPAPSPTSPPPRPAPVAPSPRYGVEVATFIDQSRAVEERDRLAARIGLPCSIATTREDGAQVFSILVGPVPDRQEAVRLSEDLAGRKLVGQARVVRWSVRDSTRR